MSTTVAQTRRVDRGRGHRYLLDGKEADGVTTVISNGVAKPALVGWAANVTRDYAVDHWDELAKVGPAERVKRLGGARFAELNAASGRGTDIHKLAHRLALGEEVDVPEPLEGHVDAYLQFIKDWQPFEILAETVVGNRQHNYMGTLDIVCRLGDPGSEATWIVDFKTTRSGIFPEAALQLAAYAHAEFWLDGDIERDMPKIDFGACIWIRADGYDFVPVDISDQTFRIFLYCQQMAHFTQAERGTYVGEALPPPKVA